jgi:catechol 2,3-dioxygenase-like lactoylglutathione lyase family enzyme
MRVTNLMARVLWFSTLLLAVSVPAQVIAPDEILDPNLRELQRKYFSELKRITEAAAAHNFPYHFYFSPVLGLTENGASGDSVYLRTWDDYEHHSLKLTASATSGIRRTGLRAASEEALQRRVAVSEAAGLGVGWQDGDLGIGPTYLFRDPDGHEFELYFQSQWFRPTGELKPALKNQAQAYPGRGVCVRRLDHVNFLAERTDIDAVLIATVFALAIFVGDFVLQRLGLIGQRLDLLIDQS